MAVRGEPPTSVWPLRRAIRVTESALSGQPLLPICRCLRKIRPKRTQPGQNLQPRPVTRPQYQLRSNRDGKPIDGSGRHTALDGHAR